MCIKELSFDFENKILNVEDGNKNVYCLPLEKTEKEVMDFFGIKAIPMEEIRNDINKLFEMLGSETVCDI